MSQLRKVRECEQVAAVCYRIQRSVIEFLLVQTRGSRRWTFPKGSSEPGMTHAQAAAIEAFEEAGVHGRIEEVAFMRYSCRRQADTRNARSTGKNLMVSAHLCEVLRLCKPKESNRNRTWFSIDDAKQVLGEGRKNGDAEEFARVVQRAVVRIEEIQRRKHQEINLLGAQAAPADPLRQVQFEPFSQPQVLSFQPSLSHTLPNRPAPARTLLGPARDSRFLDLSPGDVLPFSASRQFVQSRRLLTASRKAKA